LLFLIIRTCIVFLEDLADVLDKSNEFGVIVFTFGSLVSVSTLPNDVLDALKTVFSQLPQTVIWKYENDQMPGKPKNVVLCKWLPQRAILREFNKFIDNSKIAELHPLELLLKLKVI